MQGKFKNLMPSLITLLLVILAFAAGWIQGQIDGYRKKDCSGQNPEFKVYTSAVCRENPEIIECRDKVFVKCGSAEHILTLVNGTGEFAKGWMDVRR